MKCFFALPAPRDALISMTVTHAWSLRRHETISHRLSFSYGNISFLILRVIQDPFKVSEYSSRHVNMARTMGPFVALLIALICCTTSTMPSPLQAIPLMFDLLRWLIVVILYTTLPRRLRASHNWLNTDEPRGNRSLFLCKNASPFFWILFRSTINLIFHVHDQASRAPFLQVIPLCQDSITFHLSGMSTNARKYPLRLLSMACSLSWFSKISRNRGKSVVLCSFLASIISDVLTSWYWFCWVEFYPQNGLYCWIFFNETHFLSEVNVLKKFAIFNLEQRKYSVLLATFIKSTSEKKQCPVHYSTGYVRIQNHNKMSRFIGFPLQSWYIAISFTTVAQHWYIFTLVLESFAPCTLLLLLWCIVLGSCSASSVIGLHAQARSHPQRHQAWEHLRGWIWDAQIRRFRLNNEHEGGERDFSCWDSRVHGARGKKGFWNTNGSVHGQGGISQFSTLQDFLRIQICRCGWFQIDGKSSVKCFLQSHLHLQRWDICVPKRRARLWIPCSWKEKVFNEFGVSSMCMRHHARSPTVLTSSLLRGPERTERLKDRITLSEDHRWYTKTGLYRTLWLILAHKTDHKWYPTQGYSQLHEHRQIHYSF